MSNRLVRLNELLQREISLVLHTRFSSEAVRITITGVRITPDLHEAKVYFTVFGNQPSPAEAIRWLGSTVPVLSQHLSKHVKMRFQPKLQFIADDQPDRADRVLRLLDELDGGGAEGRR